jgi:hypothetical protein
MKYLALILSVLTLISCTHKKIKKNDLEALHYKGKVKSIEYKVYKAVQDSTGKVAKRNLISKIQSLCDQRGYFVEKSSYKGEKLSYRMDRKYDSAGRTLEETEMKQAMVYLAPGGAKDDSFAVNHTIYTFKLDANGNETELKTTQNNKPWYRDVNTYDDRGNLIQMDEYVPWDTLNKKEYYKYDSKNNLTEKKGYKANGKMFFKYTYKYDGMGDITELLAYKGDSTLDMTEEMQYDDKGNKTTDTQTLPDGTKNFDWKYEFTEFDKEGNWVKETSYSEGKPQAITERVIEYYK